MNDRARRTAPWTASAAVALAGWLAAPAPPRGAEAEAPDFRAIFGERYDDAVDYLEQNPRIAQGLRLSAEDCRRALAVVFPELIRFGYLQDKLQVRTLKVLYVQYGRKYANFSVGRFQMKPSFIEQLESDWNGLTTPEEKAAAGVPAFASGDRPEIRSGRVRRLDDLDWQVRYLRLFMLIMEKRYGQVAFAGAEDRVRFYAAAYNSGYARGESGIRRAMTEKRFHLELFAPKTNYNYSDVAVHFYRQSGSPFPTPDGDHGGREEGGSWQDAPASGRFSSRPNRPCP